MIRTQVYLTEEQAQHIKLRARQERKSEALFIRELLDAGLQAQAAKSHKLTTGQSLMQLVELGKKYGTSGPVDLSTNLDDYLYGDKK